MNENKLFNFWLKASAEECLFENNYEENKINFSKLWNQNLTDDDTFYDPNFRFKTEFLNGLDIIPDKIWYLYRPCANYEISRKGWDLYNYYNFKIINPIVLQQNKNYIKVKENFIKRRYYNSFISSVKIFYTGSKPDLIIHNEDSFSLKYINFNLDNINEVLYKNKDYSDIIVLCFNEKNKTIVLDNFIPAYPIWYSKNTIILTPIILQQINGCNHLNPIQSLYSRIADELGAILVRNMEEDLPEYEKEDIKKGISDYENNIFKDGRIKKLIPEYTRHIPFYGHGWIVSDTTFTLSAVMKAIKPKIILELGNWMGLSSRVMSNSSINKNYTIYNVDTYTNSVNLVKLANSFLHPISKMLLNHPRYETFCANNTSREGIDKTSRFYFDKQDLNNEKDTILMKMDAYEAIEILHKNNIKPDLIFIDFETNAEKLEELIYKLMFYFPKAVIVGDDLMLPNVAKAIKNIETEYKRTYMESYIITPTEELLKNIETQILQKSELEPTKYQQKIRDDIYSGIFNSPFTSILSQTGFAIHSYFKGTKGNIILQLEDILYNTEKWEKWEAPIHAPGSITPFDYYNFKFTYH